jgi:mRNA-degrading endonuclease RelE of RelBE toxin-antitoxin system
MPEIDRIVPEKNEPNLRELIIGNFRIIYQIKSETEIIILIVHYSSRSLPI